MTEQELGPARQNAGTSMQLGAQEENVKFFTGNIPFQMDEHGNVMRGNIPARVMVNNWSLTSPHLGLGNFDQTNLEVVDLMIREIVLTEIAKIPEKKFTLARFKELQQLELNAYLLATKSKPEGGGRERMLWNTNINRSIITDGEVKEQSKKSIWNLFSWW